MLGQALFFVTRDKIIPLFIRITGTRLKIAFGCPALAGLASNRPWAQRRFPAPKSLRLFGDPVAPRGGFPFFPTSG